MQKLLYASIIFLFLSCSKSSNSPLPLLSPVESRKNIVQQIISKQVDIQPVNMHEQLKIKTLAMTYIGVNINSNLTFNYEYDNRGRITNINTGQNDNFLTIKYDDDKKTVTENEVSFKTDNEGKIMALTKEPDYQMFVYKNGYPLERSGIYLNKFDSNGNIIQSEREGVFTFEYTNFPNNIRQEIARLGAFQLNFRDTYAGKFSTNLIKKCTADKVFGMSGKDELTFDYEFDEKQRVSKMTINRLSDKRILTYEYTYY